MISLYYDCVKLRRFFNFCRSSYFFASFLYERLNLTYTEFQTRNLETKGLAQEFAHKRTNKRIRYNKIYLYNKITTATADKFYLSCGVTSFERMNGI